MPTSSTFPAGGAAAVTVGVYVLVAVVPLVSRDSVGHRSGDAGERGQRGEHDAPIGHRVGALTADRDRVGEVAVGVEQRQGLPVQGN